MPARRRTGIRGGDGRIQTRNLKRLGENPSIATIANSTKQLMFSTILEPPVHRNRSSAGNASALRTWLAAAARRLAGHAKAPMAPAARNRAREAEAVRTLAHTHRATDRGFADDLYAAAARHESTAN